MNKLYTSNSNMTITYRRARPKELNGGEVLHFTLHGPNNIIGKAPMTADQIVGYILKMNGITNDTDNTKDKLQKLLDEIEVLLNNAPEEECSIEEDTMYAEMTKLKMSIRNTIQLMEKEEEIKND